MFLPDRDKVSGVTCGLEFLPRGSLLFCTIESLDVSGDASFEEKVGSAKSGACSRSSCIRQRKHPSKLEEKVRPQSPRKNCRRLRLRLASIWEEKVNPSPPHFSGFPHYTPNFSRLYMDIFFQVYGQTVNTFFLRTNSFEPAEAFIADDMKATPPP